MNKDRLQKIIEQQISKINDDKPSSLQEGLADFAKTIERETMIRCVKMIEDNAKERYIKYANTLYHQGDTCVDYLKVTCIDMQDGASPLLDELGMSFPACQEHQGV